MFEGCEFAIIFKAKFLFHTNSEPYLKSAGINNKNNDRFILLRKMTKETQRRRSLHIGRTLDYCNSSNDGYW